MPGLDGNRLLRTGSRQPGEHEQVVEGGALDLREQLLELVGRDDFVAPSRRRLLGVTNRRAFDVAELFCPVQGPLDRHDVPVLVSPRPIRMAVHPLLNVKWFQLADRQAKQIVLAKMPDERLNPDEVELIGFRGRMFVVPLKEQIEDAHDQLLAWLRGGRAGRIFFSLDHQLVKADFRLLLVRTQIDLLAVNLNEPSVTGTAEPRTARFSRHGKNPPARTK